MNKNTPEYLSLKRISIISLIIIIGFHLLMTLSFFFGDSLFSNEARNMPPHQFQYLRFFTFIVMDFIMVFLILLYNRKIMSYSFKNKYSELIIIILGSMIIATAFCVGYLFMQDGLDMHRPGPKFLIDTIVRDLTLTTVAILVVQLLRAQYYQKNIAVENETLRSENILTRFEALKNLLDPHFLFNSLNTLQSLIALDTEKAENYLQQLSSVLRYTLQNKEVINLEDELKCVQAYCDMMQIRYGENLKFEFKIDPKYNNFKVLPLSLQSLIENSVKHNVISSKQPLVVTVATDDDSVSVSNPIQLKTSPEEGNGIGLVNLTERYRLKWNKIVEITNDGSTFCVKLPLQKD